jgi:hypothetical protein
MQEKKNILICERCDLLFWFLVIREGLFILLPVLARGAGHDGRGMTAVDGLLRAVKRY